MNVERFFLCAKCGQLERVQQSAYACACIHYLREHGRRVDVVRMVLEAAR